MALFVVHDAQESLSVFAGSSFQTGSMHEPVSYPACISPPSPPPPPPPPHPSPLRFSTVPQTQKPRHSRG